MLFSAARRRTATPLKAQGEVKCLPTTKQRISNMHHDPNIAGIIVAIIAGLGLVLAVLWIILPIAVFGIKNRLDKLITIESAILQGLTKRDDEK